MFPKLLLSFTTLIYTYLILIYTIALKGEHGIFALGGDTVFFAAANTVLVSCAGAAGMACFAFGFRRLSERLQGRIPLAMVGLCALGQLFLEIFPAAPAIFSLGVLLSMLGWGFLTAWALYRVATEVSSEYFGRFVGLSCGLSALLQFIIGTADTYFAALPLTSMTTLPCLIALAILARTPLNASSFAPPEVPHAWQSLFLKNRLLLLLGTALLSLLMGLSDSVTIMHFDEYAPAFPASRLFYAMGLFFFGWLADRRFAYLPVIVLLANTYYLWFRALHTDAEIFRLLSQLVEAVYSAPAIILLAAGFLHAATRSQSPERWASMGRIIGLPMTSLGLVLGLGLWPLTSTQTMLAFYTTLLLIAVVLLYRGTLACLLDALHEAAKSKAPVNCPPAKEPGISDEAFYAYCHSYNLTAKETAVLSDILKGMSAEEIAEAKSISKRTVRFHISNLLHKTGNQTQLAMIAHFHHNANTDSPLQTEIK